MPKNVLFILVTMLLVNATVFSGDGGQVNKITLSGKFKVGTNWVPATLTAQTINQTANDCGTINVTSSAPYSLRGMANEIISESDCVGYSGKFIEGRDSGDDANRKHSKIANTNEGLSITSDNILDIEIYDYLGRCVYTAKDKNISIDKNTLNLTNGTYLLRLVNKEGKEEISTFMFDGSSFIFSNSKE